MSAEQRIWVDTSKKNTDYDPEAWNEDRNLVAARLRVLGADLQLAADVLERATMQGIGLIVNAILAYWEKDLRGLRTQLSSVNTYWPKEDAK